MICYKCYTLRPTSEVFVLIQLLKVILYISLVWVDDTYTAFVFKCRSFVHIVQSFIVTLDPQGLCVSYLSAYLSRNTLFVFGNTYICMRKNKHLYS